MARHWTCQMLLSVHLLSELQSPIDGQTLTNNLTTNCKTSYSETTQSFYTIRQLGGAALQVFAKTVSQWLILHKHERIRVLSLATAKRCSAKGLCRITSKFCRVKLKIDVQRATKWRNKCRGWTWPTVSLLNPLLKHFMNTALDHRHVIWLIQIFYDNVVSLLSK